MSEISLSSQQLLTAAIKQLSGHTGGSPSSQHGTQLLIQHTAGNQASLVNPKTNRSLSIPKTSLPSNLGHNNLYSATLSHHEGKSQIHFFGANAPIVEQVKITQLNQKQLTKILQLSQFKLEPSNRAAAHTLVAKIDRVSPELLSLKIQGSQSRIEIPTDNNLVKQINLMKVGQSVLLKLVPSTKQWDVTLGFTVNTQTQPTKPPTGNSDRASQHSTAKTAMQLVAETLSAQAGKSIEIKLNDKQASIILSHQIGTNTKGSDSILNLNQEPNAKHQNRETAVLQNTIEKYARDKGQTHFNLVNEGHNKVNLTAKVSQPLGTLELNAHQTAQAKTLMSSTVQNQQLNIGYQGTEAPSHSTNVTRYIDSIQAITRQLQPISDSAAKSLNAIYQAFEAFSESESTTLKPLIDSALAKIKQNTIQMGSDDSIKIKQLLNISSQMINSQQIAGANTSSGLVGGLVTLVQLALAARLSREQPALNDKLNQLMGATNKSNTTNSSTKVGFHELGQLESKQQILKEMSRLLAGHQINKLSGAEQSIQGQDTLFYTLPSASNGQFRDIELSIKRQLETPYKNQSDQNKLRTWHLTMKMDIDNIGQLLSKAKYNDNGLELQFYASNERVEKKVDHFIPNLKDRLNKVGVNLVNSQVQLGKIPDSLQSRPYQMFETQA